MSPSYHAKPLPRYSPNKLFSNFSVMHSIRQLFHPKPSPPNGKPNPHQRRNSGEPHLKIGKTTGFRQRDERSFRRRMRVLPVQNDGSRGKLRRISVKTGFPAEILSAICTKEHGKSGRKVSYSSCILSHENRGFAEGWRYYYCGNDSGERY